MTAFQNPSSLPRAPPIRLAESSSRKRNGSWISTSTSTSTPMVSSSDCVVQKRRTYHPTKQERMQGIQRPQTVRQHGGRCSNRVLLGTFIVISVFSTCYGFIHHSPLNRHLHHYRYNHRLKTDQRTPRPTLSTLQSSNNNGVVDNSDIGNAPLTSSKDESSSSSSSSYLIPPEQLEHLIESVDIVSAIESYNLPQFRRSGATSPRATAVCPFHDDTNPSLQIDGTRRIYKCFSCGAGGNILQFVREYAKVSTGEELSFLKAVQQVNEKFTNGSPLPLRGGVGGSGGSKLTTEEFQALAVQKERILLANTVAAAFYANCLISMNGGAARSHLASRGLLAPTVRAFAIGFAPDAYYGNQILVDSPHNNKTWGKGSLVYHLRDSNFTPQEIVDAGLAVRTKRTGGGTSSNNEPPTKLNVQTNITIANNGNATSPTVDPGEDMDYTILMDRFRGRLVVPIFDVTGTKVLGFGGRILGQAAKTKNFNAPKYLNSPDSRVFKKKTILFGHHMAKEAIDKAFRETNEDKEAKTTRRPVILVEGYMDAMALWQAGIKEVVACMGTGLTEEQLLAAARIAGSRGGSVVLCLDGDDAGITAVERVCSSGLLASVSSRLATEIRVATLPEGRKDPAEYIELHQKSFPTQAGEDFRSNVIDTSVEWTGWYLNRIMGRFDPSVVRGDLGSFGDVFERVANFLATFQNAADRTEQACQVAASLADIMSSNGSTGPVSNTVRIQLESDLVDKVSRIAMSKEAATRRLESVEGGSEIEIKAKLSNLSRGVGPSGSDELEKLSSKAIRATPTKPSTKPIKKKSTRSSYGSKNPPKVAERRGYKPPKDLVKQDVIPHHQGFAFKHESDQEWMQSDGENKRQKDDGLNMARSLKNGAINEFGQKKPVWFNSNEYNGERFITDEAVSAGYSSIVNVRDPSLLGKGISALIEPDPDTMSSSAETTLLRALVLYRRARTTLKDSMDVSSVATGSPGEGIEWSDADMAWLFSRLVENGNTIPTSLTGPEHAFEIRSHLANLPDTPPGAFGVLDENGVTRGTADLDPPLDVAVGSIMTADTLVDFVAADMDNVDDWAASVSQSYLEMVEEGSEALNESTIASEQRKALPRIVEATNEVLLGSDSAGESLLGQDMSQTTTKSRDGQIVDAASTGGHIGSRLVDSPGTLDRFFSSLHDIFTSSCIDTMTPDERAALAVRDLYATLLWTSSLRRLSRLRENLLLASNTLQNLGNHNVKRGPVPEGDFVVGEGTLTREELLGYCSSLTAQIRDAFETSHHLGSSARRISKGLMNAAIIRPSEFRICKNEYNKLCETMDQHMAELNQYPENVPENDIDIGECYEDSLELMQLEWGEIYHDGRMWSIEDVEEDGRPTNKYGSDKIVNAEDMNYLYEGGSDAGDEDEESLEDFDKRLAEDYAAWNEMIPS